MEARLSQALLPGGGVSDAMPLDNTEMSQVALAQTAVARHSSVGERRVGHHIGSHAEWQPHERPLAGEGVCSRMLQVLRKLNMDGWLGGEEMLRRRWATRARLLSPLHRAACCGVTVGELAFAVFAASQIYTAFSTRGTVKESGEPADHMLSVALIMAVRNSLLAPLCGLTWQRGLYYHKGSAWLAIFLGIRHGYVRLTTTREEQEADKHDEGRQLHGHHGDEMFADLGPDQALLPCRIQMTLPPSWSHSNSDCSVVDAVLKMHDTQSIYGSILLVAMLAMSVIALLPVVRRRCFNLFLSSHVILFAVVVVFGLLHGGGTVGIVLMLIDYFVRYVIMCNILPFLKAIGSPSVAGQATVVSDDLLLLRLAKPPPNQVTGGELCHRAGQYVFINVPAVSKIEWHPFSLASVDLPAHGNNARVDNGHLETLGMALYIRTLGDWTSKLHRHVQQLQQQRLEVRIEGPYGGPTVGVDLEGDRYHSVVLLAGGVGASPLLSIASALLSAAERGRQLSRLHFVWAVRDAALVSSAAAEGLLPAAPRLASAQQSPLVSEVYLTQRGAKPEQHAQLGAALATIAPETTVFAGRPDLPAVFSAAEAHARSNDEERVAVIVCGPLSLSVEAKKLVATSSTTKCGSAGVVFDLHEESFLL